MTAQAETQTRHGTSLAMWDVPAVAAGERFRVTVGAKSEAGCPLGGGRIEVLDDSGAVVGSGALGREPWLGTAALYWVDLELTAAAQPGTMELTARFDAASLDEPHQNASATFGVSVVAPPEHVLTVTLASGGVPIEGAYLRLGPMRATTDAAGVATVKLAKGRYELVAWKAGFDIAPLPLSIETDTAVTIEGEPLPEDDPDAIWTA